MNRAVFLDRDGVLNEAVLRDGRPYPPAHLGEVVLTPGVGKALRQLRDAGFLLFCVTNQPDVSRGTSSEQTVQEIHEFLSARLPIDEFLTCFHDDRDRCDCRKPAPGLLLRAAVKHQICLETSYMIGDRWRDVDAGAAAGCRTVLIDYGYSERGPAHPPSATVSSLPEAVEWLLCDADLSSRAKESSSARFV